MESIYEERPWVKLYQAEASGAVGVQAPVKSLGQAFNEAADKWSKRTAIVFYGNKIAYNELKHRVDKFATALAALGVTKGDRVALLLLNCPEYVVAFYAIVKIGATVCPVSPVYVSQEIRQQLEDSGAETIICQDMLYDKVEQAGIRLKRVILADIATSLPATKRFMGRSILRGVYQNMAVPSSRTYEFEGFYRFEDLVKQYPSGPPEAVIDPKKDIAIMPYTGGTTGQPKGVMITHYNILSENAQVLAIYPFLKDGEEVMVAYMPFYHIGGLVRSVCSGILHGATQIVITTPEPDEILNAISRYGVTFFFGAPALYAIFNDHDKTDWVNWKRIKIVISGADTLYESIARRFAARTGVVIHDSYGITESSAGCALTPRDQVRAGSVGIPLPNTILAVADPEEERLLPVGEMGEIVVFGPQICVGYWKNPEATKESQAIISGERWLRTGDIGMMDKDGYVYLYDRKRDLIKYKGLRVHAREVEDILTCHPQIREVGIVGVPDVKVGELVKAFIVLESEARGRVSEAQVIEYCQDKLAHYKIPRIVEFVGEIPKTDIGKVSRRELREMER